MGMLRMKTKAAILIGIFLFSLGNVAFGKIATGQQPKCDCENGKIPHNNSEAKQKKMDKKNLVALRTEKNGSQLSNDPESNTGRDNNQKQADKKVLKIKTLKISP